MLPLALALALTWLAALPPVLESAGSRAGTALAARLETVGAVLDGVPEEPRYVAEERAVSNWRGEAAENLSPGAIAALAALLDVDRPVVTRCVKLNNYWCIKRARWNGEIGFDEEGHVGFASADRAADAAAGLLRRYYLDFGRRSALDIVRRWAPAECRPVSSGGGVVASLPAGAPLAVRGLQNTLRARYLARVRGGPARPRTARGAPAVPPPNQAPAVAVAAAAAAPPRVAPPQAAAPQATVPRPTVSVQPAARPSPAPARVAAPLAAPRAAPRSRVSSIPLRPLPEFRVPDIAAGMGERPRPAARPAPPRARVAAPRIRVASAASLGSAPLTTAPAPAPAAAPIPRPQPWMSCAPAEQRIQNYAARIVRDIGLGPADDLRLFDEAERPGPNLLPVMLAMSAVELGILSAEADLVIAAIERLPSRTPDAGTYPGDGR